MQEGQRQSDDVITPRKAVAATRCHLHDFRRAQPAPQGYCRKQMG